MTEMLGEPVASGATVTAPQQELVSSSARFGAFTDAVVAMAMTLLILPLMEGVPDSVDPRPPVAEFLDDHQGQLVTFCISFVLVAMFWVLHHRVVRADTPGSSLRTMVNFAWMFTIVLMPVTRRSVGRWPPTG